MKSDNQIRRITPRQASILALLRRGLTDKEMAAALNISEETVAHHLRVLFEKYDAPCRVVLVVKTLSLMGRDETSATE